MVTIAVRDLAGIYDIQPLARAFFPGEEIRLVGDDAPESDTAESDAAENDTAAEDAPKAVAWSGESQGTASKDAASEERAKGGEGQGELEGGGRAAPQGKLLWVRLADRIDASFYEDGALVAERSLDAFSPEGEDSEREPGASSTKEGEEGATGAFSPGGRQDAFRGADSLDDEGKRRYKNQMKRAVYEALSEATGKELPWGTLTGVRPTKIPMARLLAGEGEEGARKAMRRECLCREDKADMAVRIAARELSILRGAGHEGGYSLYVGIPFCPTTCAYCSFTSFPIEGGGQRVRAYMDALSREMEYVGSRVGGKAPTCVYVGGGTPTSLPEGMLRELLRRIREAFPLDGGRELTVEAGRPDSITEEKLGILREGGATRISINPQTMREETLRRIGRSHTVAQVREAFALARGMGYDNINMDLIVGLPGEDLGDARRSLREVIGLSPEGITIHSLVTKRAARMNLLREEEPCEDEDAMAEQGYRLCLENGYEPYYMYRQKNAAGSARSGCQENVGYAREGKECLYNILMMEEAQTILALGAGASSKFVAPGRGLVGRADNVKSLGDYIGRVDEMIDRKRRFLGG